MVGFALSLIVAVATTVFTKFQADAVTDAICARLQIPTLAEAAARQPMAQDYGLNQHPALVRTHVAHAIDIAGNFPAGILTAYALYSTPQFPDAAEPALLIFVFIFTALCVGLANPRFAIIYASRGTVKDVVSWLSIAIVVANIAGLAFSIYVAITR